MEILSKQQLIVNQFNHINRFKLRRWWLIRNTVDQQAKDFYDSIMDQIKNSSKDYNVIIDNPPNIQELGVL